MLQICWVILRENNDEISEKGGEIQKKSVRILVPPEKKRNIDIRNEGVGGGGVKGRLDFIRKFIRFGRPGRPLSVRIELSSI